MGNEFDRFVVKDYEGMTAAELAAAPPDALSGVSSGDAAKLEAAFGITSIRDLATSRFYRTAAAIVAEADGVPDFDPGPSPEWEARFAAAPLDTYEKQPAGVFRVDFGPVFYRGRLDGTARLLVIGQDPSVNEILAQRAFVGKSGQRLQGFLAKLGITRSYLMLNTFSYSIFDTFGGANERLSHEDPILSYRNDQFDAAAEENPLEAVLTVGSAARDAVDRWPEIGSVPRVHIIHPSFPNTGQLLQNWNTALAALRPLVPPDDEGAVGADYGNAFVAADIVSIPRRDLPFGIPDWHGVGDHAKRDGNRIIEWRADEVT